MTLLKALASRHNALHSVKIIQNCGITLSVLALIAHLALQIIHPPKTDAATGDRLMLSLEFYVFFYSWFVQ